MLYFIFSMKVWAYLDVLSLIMSFYVNKMAYLWLMLGLDYSYSIKLKKNWENNVKNIKKKKTKKEKESMALKERETQIKDKKNQDIQAFFKDDQAIGGSLFTF